jgi:hypothetical protein
MHYLTLTGTGTCTGTANGWGTGTGMPIFLVKNVCAWPPRNTGCGRGAGYGGGGNGAGNGGGAGPYPKPAHGSGGGAGFLNQPLNNPRLTRATSSLVTMAVVAKSKICVKSEWNFVFC